MPFDVDLGPGQDGEVVGIGPQGEARPTSTTSLLLRHRITTGQRGAANGPGLLVDTATDNAVTVTATSPNQGSTGPTRITRNDDTTYSDGAPGSGGGSLRLEQEPFMGGLDGGKVATGLDLNGRAEAQGVEIDGASG
ncbi:MAG: hypothetical protein MSC31_05430 [Solirubrobacteraceae bacterium MAG38_C4-C5]|nr:hypothetical protein [Candidatus Siliceabacter maunaloa]